MTRQQQDPKATTVKPKAKKIGDFTFYDYNRLEVGGEEGRGGVNRERCARGEDGHDALTA
jgi:hypothetical protein